ncbi:MAG TPA: 3-deoxy-manno-octulosonate cytidylyltransferase, partial [Candidatus Omnitrophota bacterium]|nr:3-deoxy-manno-octulosonate cytidylyltransferase [Candidatus Omnitrophota bacterium]
ELIVATDDRRIFDVVSGFGGNVVMTSSRHPTGTDRVAEVSQKLDSDIIVNVQGDEPLIMPQMLAQVVQPLLDERSINVTNAITQIVSPADYLDATVVKAVKDKKGDLLYLTRSPIPFPRSRERFVIYKQIGLYAFRRPFLRRFVQMEQTDLELVEGIEFLRLLENGYRVRAVISQYNPISVDTISDLKEVEKIMKKDKSTHPQ